MGRKYEYPNIGNNPISRNLAYLFRHPESGHPIPQRSPDRFWIEIKEIHEEIKKLYPDENTTTLVPKTIGFYIIGKRNPTIDSMIKLTSAYKSIYKVDIDPYDLFVDRSKWLNTAHFSPEQKEICENVKFIQKQTILEGILAFSRSETESLDPVSLNRCKYSDDPFYFPIDGN